MSNTVYIVQEPVTWRDGKPTPKFDLRPAAKFGMLWPLLPIGATNFTDTRVMVATIRDGLRCFMQNDYLMCIGDPVAIAAAAIAAAERTGGFVNLLKWDNRLQDYLMVNLNMSEVRNERFRANQETGTGTAEA